MWVDDILVWYKKHGRTLPWRGEKDPYKIWLSEIILQQTRIDQGKDYYFRIIEKWPTIQQLSTASEDEILKAWQGLGYYSRARNALKCAKTVSSEWNGKFPQTYAELLQLSGVGTYTAAAIASIAFGVAKGVVDGNVIRLVSRLICLPEDVSQAKTRKKIQEFVDEWIPKKHPGAFNQALMDVGSVICTPKKPKCEICPLLSSCNAAKQGNPERYPVKQTKIEVKPLYVTYFHFQDAEGNTYIRKRQKGIWMGLYEFPGCFSEKETFSINGELSLLLKQGEKIGVWQTTHMLTHKRMHIDIHRVFMDKLKETKEYKKVTSESFSSYAFPKPIEKYLQTRMK